MSGPLTPGPMDVDPRTEDAVLAAEDDGPVVGRTTRAVSPILPIAGIAVAAVALFLVLNARRTERADAGAAVASPGVQATDWSPPPPLELPLTPISTNGPAPFSGLSAQVINPTVSSPVVASATLPGAASPSTSDLLQRRRAPAVVIDLGGAPRDTVLAQAGPAGGATVGAAALQGAAGSRPQLSDSEQFAKRVGDEEPERARAVPMRNPRAIAPQGTIIPGVLETAINSDLPGFTRAVVSRDVLSFDGKAILIPRGSRLIGQYKSAVALGQSRAFIIWTRVIRPDGVSIQIGSPGTDELGRGGLNGEVNRHFFRRFSGSILLSVLNAGVASVGQTPATQISIGSAGAATGLATQAVQGDAIPPTIKVAQGEAINIFVARDLDFSAVGPAS